MKELEKIAANQKFIEDLYSSGKLNTRGRKVALDFLCSQKQWGYFISLFLLSIGSTLILAGIIYFFAFNWMKISPIIKLSLIEISLIGCLLGSYLLPFKKISSKILLLAGSILVGVFMAVFGQIYQTGADSYQLFMMWSLLTLGWTLISKFAAQWVFWLIITNIFLVFWWDQWVLPSKEMEFMIFTYIIILNGLALFLREYLVMKKGQKWLEEKWLQVILIISILLTMLIPICRLVLFYDVTISVVLSAFLGVIGYVLAYYFYRYKQPNIFALSAIMFCVCIIINVMLIDEINIGSFFFIGILNIALFSLIIFFLQKVVKEIKTKL